MKKRNILLMIGKIIVSGVIAFAILTLFCCLYYNLPVHRVCDDGVTDFKYESNKFLSRWTEGFAWGRTNNEGYLNIIDYYDGDPVNVLIMGSSNMEAFNVQLEESTAGRLNAILKDETVYNIGLANHSFLSCAQNLRAAVKKYRPSGYVVVEAPGINFSNEELRQAIDGEYGKINAYAGGIVGFLQRNQYLRLLYSQLFFSNIFRFQVQEGVENGAEKEIWNDAELLGELLRVMNREASENGTTLIVVYHPQIEIGAEGSLQFTDDQDVAKRFREQCERNDILLLDMSDRIIKEYRDNYLLPYGFSNTPVGEGHMNRYGHAMLADELFRMMEVDQK